MCGLAWGGLVLAKAKGSSSLPGLFAALTHILLLANTALKLSTVMHLHYNLV